MFSIVIMDCQGYWKACLRFQNSSLDQDIAVQNRNILMYKIESYVTGLIRNKQISID